MGDAPDYYAGHSPAEPERIKCGDCDEFLPCDNPKCDCGYCNILQQFVNRNEWCDEY